MENSGGEGDVPSQAEDRPELAPADRPERERLTKVAILWALFDVYPADLNERDTVFDEIREQATSRPADEERLDGAAVVADALGEMLRSCHIRRRIDARSRLRITPDGMEWLALNRPGLTFDEMDRLGNNLIRNTAKLARSTEVLEEKHADVESATRKLDQQQRTIERRLGDADREVFRRVIPFFALFAAAFALINASSQAAIHAFTPAGQSANPGETFWINAAQAGGVMLPVGLVIVVLLIAAWLLVRFIP